MIYVRETEKSIENAVTDLTAAVQARGFSVLHTYDLQAKMIEKGVDFSHACRILEVCNPHRAAEVLGEDMRISLALPCRICVFEKDGKTQVGTIQPTDLIAVFAGGERLNEVARVVETEIVAMVDAAV